MSHSSAGPIKKIEQAINKNRKRYCKVSDASEVFSYLCLNQMVLEFSLGLLHICFLIISYFLLHCPGISCCFVCCFGGACGRLYSLSQTFTRGYVYMASSWPLVEKALPHHFQCLALLQPIGYQQMFCKQKFEMYLCSSTCSLILQASPSKEKESESQCCTENKRNKEQTCSLEPNPCRSAKHKLKYRCMSEKQILIFRSHRIWGCFATLLWWQLTNTVLSNLQVLFSFDDYKFLKNNKFYYYQHGSLFQLPYTIPILIPSCLMILLLGDL